MIEAGRGESSVSPSAEGMAKENEVSGEGNKSALKEEETPAKVGDQENREKSDKQKGTMVPFHKLFSFADSIDIVLMVIGTLAAVANGAVQPLTVFLFGRLINSFGRTAYVEDVVNEVSKVLQSKKQQTHAAKHVKQVALEFVYLAVGAGIASFLQVASWMVTGERQAARIRNVYLKTILKQEIAFFDMEVNSGEVVGRMSGDTVLIQDAMGEKVGKFIQLTSTFFGGFIVALTQGWLLTLVMLCTIPPLVFAGAIMSTVIAKMACRGQAAYSEAAVAVEQTLGSIRTVASYTGEKESVSKYKECLKRAYGSSVQEEVAAGLGLGTVMFIFFCGFSLGIWYGSKLIMDKGYTGGNVFSVIFAVLTGSLSLGQSSPCITGFAEGRAAAFKMFETINRTPEINCCDPTGKNPKDIQGDIEFKDVYFCYPARPDEQIFSGFSLSIKSGTTAALVGESGSGKTTVISLIERFYDPQAGEVLIDGLNLKEFNLTWIRGKIALVSQEPILFSSSIRDNIAYGKKGATTEEIRAAADIANASKFIDKMPKGMDTMVGEYGAQLSGGQKQRIAIARAILKDPRILLLDEATSALDAESERLVQEALDKVMRNRTTVVVAHRLSTVRSSDTIAVLQKGLVVQKGRGSELLKDPNGAYCQLIRLQEMSRDLEQYTEIDQECSFTLGEAGRQASNRISLTHSYSRSHSYSRARSVGGSNRHSFSISFGLPVGLSFQEGAKEPDSDIPSQLPDVSLQRLAYLNKPELSVLIFGVIAAIMNGVILPIFGVLLSKMINTFFETPSMLKEDSRFYSEMFIGIGAISLLALPARHYLFAVAGSRLIRRIRLMTFEKVLTMEIGWFDDSRNLSGAIGARLSVDAAAIRNLVGDALAEIVQNSATLLAGLVIAFTANWQLSLIILALIPLIGLNGWIQNEFIKGFSADAKMMYEEASQVANDAVANIKTVASYSAEEKVMELYEKKCEGPAMTGIKQGVISGISFGLSFFLLYCVYATSFYAGARLVGSGKTTFGKVFQVFFALAMAAIGISQSSSVAQDSAKAKFAAASLFEILDRKSKIDPSVNTGMILEELKGNIEFRHVRFCYPTRPDVQIFQDLSLTIQSGKSVALVGESGSGKSTAISLLQRFYDPDSGQIFLDGTDIRKFQLRWLRQQMGLVSQEPILFNDTIRANIEYGKDGKAAEAEISAAAESANAHMFISSLQQGYDTIVGERGTQLSGGQKQRVAIARAIMKEPKILLLDEATSALDAESEHVVQDALDRVMVNRTTVIIAHRLSTIKGCDLIAVVKDGAIVEKGNHEKLVKIKDGAYASLLALHQRAT